MACVAIIINTLLVGDVYLTGSGMLISFAFFLYVLGFFAGGDFKLISVLSLNIPIESVPGFIIDMFLIGGILSLLYLIKNKLMSNVGRGVPYGVAISLAYVLVQHSLVEAT
ncbi:hypothetical protein [Vibrio paucivorans]